MINATFIMNFVEEQEVLSLSIWPQHKLDGKRRQANEIKVTGPLVVRDRDLEMNAKTEKGWQNSKQIQNTGEMTRCSNI